MMVKRYRVYCQHWPPCNPMAGESEGEYVMFADYEQLQDDYEAANHLAKISGERWKEEKARAERRGVALITIRNALPWNSQVKDIVDTALADEKAGE